MLRSARMRTPNSELGARRSSGTCSIGMSVSIPPSIRPMPTPTITRNTPGFNCPITLAGSGRFIEVRGVRLLRAEVHQPRDLASKILAVDDEVEEPVLLEEFRPLEPFGQLDLDRVPDRPRPGEAD